MHEVCISHRDTSPMGTARGRNKHKKNRKRVIRNMKGENLGTIRLNSPKQGLTSAKDLTMYSLP